MDKKTNVSIQVTQTPKALFNVFIINILLRTQKLKNGSKCDASVGNSVDSSFSG